MISAKEARELANKMSKEIELIEKEILRAITLGTTSITFETDISNETKQILIRLGYDVYYECRANDNFLTIDWGLSEREKDD